MTTRSIGLAAVCGCAFALSGAVVTAHAANINVGTDTCIPDSGAPKYAWAVSSGMTNVSMDALAHLICAVPRSPLPANATAAGFFVDGLGSRTACTITSYDYTGQFPGKCELFRLCGPI